MANKIKRPTGGPPRADAPPTTAGRGLSFGRYFSAKDSHPYDQIAWARRDAVIRNAKGDVIFEQNGVDAPVSWSQSALNITVSKYFRGTPGSSDRESDIRQLVGRVTDTITAWGREGGYFRNADSADVFSRELAYLLVNQMASFNSPVWFNVGVEQRPQCSACFINSVEDTMDSILDLAKVEGRLFKYGSGAGTNLSPLRSSRERLSTGGVASGPVSFMKGYDAFAGVIKSGGKTRRAAKMVILNVDHPDIAEFVQCKAKEERKARALIAAGYDASFNGEAYGSIFFQNANNSVRVTDEFMRALEDCGVWRTRSITTGEVVQEFQARDLLDMMAECAHVCGDPGIQFDTTINRWNTCKESGRIEASNPCSEYMFLNDSACNLASLNLMKFLDGRGEFSAEKFQHAIDIVFAAQEILVSNASYPTTKIERNSHDFRPLGLGYANLGALLMYMGVPYDSDEGRLFAAGVTALMTGRAYLMSAKIASALGPFAHFEKNRGSFLEVMEHHRRSLEDLDAGRAHPKVFAAAKKAWDAAVAEGGVHGFRNAQATVLAPTGTIGFMMDCDTTGIEPDLGLVKFKQLVGDGVMVIVNQTVEPALRRLGYTAGQIAEIVDHVRGRGTVEGAPAIRGEHLPVFDCALKPEGGTRFIHHMGHVRMMAAVQPFLSGAISKTVNMPQESTRGEVADVFVEAWRLGIKAVAVYRDGSKGAQPVSVDKKRDKAQEKADYQPVRRKLPVERKSMTHKFKVADHEGYITVGTYDDGKPGEIFLLMAKEGSVISGFMDGFATAISMALQYGVPLDVLVDKFTHTRFEPSGFTGNPHIPMAKSILDYVFKWLALKFLPVEEQTRLGIIDPAPPTFGPASETAVGSPASPQAAPHPQHSDAPLCCVCGSLMVRNGSCYKCANCGTQEGCS